MFGGSAFQRTVGIPMGTNCAPLSADLFLYSYEADFIQGIFKKNEKKLARSFNFTFRYIDILHVLSLNNTRFGDFVDRIYPIELEIKNTTYTDRSASYLDLHLEIEIDFNFPIVNFQSFVPFLLAIVLSVLRYTDSDYPIGIFKLFMIIVCVTNL
jgi:hypothetical protein